VNAITKFSYTILFTLAFSLVLKKAEGFDSTGIVKNGVADLRQINVDDKPLALKGRWSFAWKKLLTPGDTVVFSNFIEFPSLWNNALVGGERLSSAGYASYGLTIFLPRDHLPLALYAPEVYSSFRLYVNGAVLAANGVPGSSKKNYMPQWSAVTVSLPEHTDTLRLILQVANFSHAKGGTNINIEIGNSKAMFLRRDRNIASDFLLAGCIFMGGLFFLGLYLFGTRDKATLYFALFCMLYSYRFVGSSVYALHALYPNFSWETAIRCEYLSLFVSILLFIQYVRNLYPGDIYKPAMNLLSCICISVSVLPILTPSAIFTQVIDPFLILMFFCIVYLMCVFIKAFIRKRIAAGYALVSIAVIMIVQFIINLEYFGMVMPSRPLLFVGYISFFFFQSMVLSFRFAHALNLAKKEAEQGLVAKSEFLSTMSHEIRTPLNSVIGMSNLMLRNRPRPDQKEQLDVLQFSAKNLLSIVNDILDYNKIEAGKITFEQIEMNLPEIAGNIVAGAKNAADDKGILVKIHIDTAISHYVLGDPTRLSQVLHNLVGNAVKFTNEGEVLVELAVLDKKDDSIDVLFTVKDTGIGIPTDKQQLIFERFTQADSSTSRSFGGTGLGLAITQKILSLQESKLQLRSEAGKGSAFFFIQTFSLTKKLLEQKRESRFNCGKEEQPLKGTNILLVEDNRINILVAKTFLESWGATIDVAENGLEAIQKLDTGRHRLVLMDLHMPVMDGYTAIKKIRENGITVPIIALTASLPGEVESEIKGLQINGFVLKPFVPDELFKKVLHFSMPAELV